MKSIISIISILIFPCLLFSQEFTIPFRFDDYSIDDESSGSLSDFLRENQAGKLLLTGYADTTGSASYNKSLVEKRLLSTRKFIQSNHPGIIIETINYGESRSLSGGKEYRKIDIRLLQMANDPQRARYKTGYAYQVDNSKDTSLVCREGTRIYIPKNSLVLKENKQIPEGEITLRVSEYYEVHEMIEADLTTQSGDELLETGGMINIQASCGENECILRKGSKMGISFKNITESDSMQLFTGRLKNDVIDWELIEMKKSELEFEESVFFVVEEMPGFMGGDLRRFTDYINSRLRYPPMAAEMCIQGRVFLQFTVDEMGWVINARVIRGIDPLLDAEALRVVSSSPRWTPGRQRGRAVPVQFTIPITFALDAAIPIYDSSWTTTSTAGKADSLVQKTEEANETIREFYLWTNQLNWLNCDRFYRFSQKNAVYVSADSAYETYYALLNGNRSVIRPNNYNSRNKIHGFENIPGNQEVLIVGIRIVNNETYLTSFLAKANGDTYTPEYAKTNKNGLKEELQKIGL